MPGLRSPAIPSTELRRVRTPSTSTVSAGARLPRSEAPARRKKIKEEGGGESGPRVSSPPSSSSSTGSSGGGPTSSARRCRRGPKKASPPVAAAAGSERRRCAWITANSDPFYVAFHDEEWGVPVHDDQKLFELLTLSQALAEMSWPTILNKREAFRKMFDDFNYSSVAEFTEKKIILLRSSGSALLSEQKIRAVVANAKQIKKVITEFGSFSNYCWSFVNQKPLANGFRYARQVPIKTPKSEAISKDLMQRGFHCVGPTTIYSFMQVAGIVNDHLSCCFRFGVSSRQKADERNENTKSTLVHNKLSSCSSEDKQLKLN